MANEFWLSIASKNLPKAKEFYSKLGFEMNNNHVGPHMVSMFVGDKNIVLNLFSETIFQEFISNPVTDTKNSNEIIFSLGANSKDKVDAMAKKVIAAGGDLYGKPGDKDGWMYGCGFADPDGHRWAVVYMDMSKLPKA
jgi:predicted lactoylglutathione lyase